MLEILEGDVAVMLRGLAGESVQMVCTSPPYWGLRDYSVPGQLGLEATPGEYVERMVEVFREVRRVLRSDGVVWLNLGDSYFTNPPGSPGDCDGISSSASERGFRDNRPALRRAGLKPKDLVGIPWRVAFALQGDGWWLRSDVVWAKPNPMPESVCDRPTKAHEYIFLLSKAANYFYDGEAIREPIKESQDGSIRARARTANGALGGENQHNIEERFYDSICGANKRSVWTIATQAYPEAHFATFPEEIPKVCILAGTSAKGCCDRCGGPWERIQSIGESDYARIKRETGRDWRDMREEAKTRGMGHDSNRAHIGGTRDANGNQFTYKAADRQTLGWQPTCTCHGHFEEVTREVERAKGSVPDGWMQAEGGHDTVKYSGRERSNAAVDLTTTIIKKQKIYIPTSESKTIPCTVLDPFAGSGTVGKVALELGRKAVLIELNPAYCKLIEARCNVTLGLALA